MVTSSVVDKKREIFENKKKEKERTEIRRMLLRRKGRY